MPILIPILVWIFSLEGVTFKTHRNALWKTHHLFDSAGFIFSCSYASIFSREALEIPSDLQIAP